MSSLFPLRTWIWISVWASATGWILSLFHQLNRLGYMAAVIAGLLFWWVLTLQKGSRPSVCRHGWAKLSRRFRHPLPFVFMVLAGLIFIGGLLYPPTNYTGLTYRVGRVLHWLGEGQWH
jgi:hypothetical protein